MAQRTAFLQFLILALVLVQLAVAQHATIHPDHSTHHDRCTLCLTAQDAAQGILTAYTDVVFAATVIPASLPYISLPSLLTAAAVYAARGPPLFPV